MVETVADQTVMVVLLQEMAVETDGEVKREAAKTIINLLVSVCEDTGRLIKTPKWSVHHRPFLFSEINRNCHAYLEAAMFGIRYITVWKAFIIAKGIEAIQSVAITYIKHDFTQDFNLSAKL